MYAAVSACSVVVIISRSKARLQEMSGNMTECETERTVSSGERLACALDVCAAVVVVVFSCAYVVIIVHQCQDGRYTHTLYEGKCRRNSIVDAEEFD